jgi:hypothetical protein
MANSASRWREPTSALPLRWGTWTGRSWGGLSLIISGGVAIAGSSAANGFTVLLAALGLTAHVIGWCVLPSRGWRRIAAIFPSTFAMIALLPGPGYLTPLVLPLLAWLVVRNRPLRVFPMAAFVIATGIVLARIFPGYEGMLTASAIALFVVVGAAWAARAVHAASTRRRPQRRAKSIVQL